MYNDKYVLIGVRLVCLLWKKRLDFRATKDLDIVLHVEALDNEFVTAFREFVKMGGYRNRQQSTGKEIFYRFDSPNNGSFPAMLELFSRTPDIVKLDIGQHLTPIPLNETATSLSAILLDDNYYPFIHAGKQEISGLPIVRASHLIPLKAKAWIELSAIEDKNARKHKNDIIRLYQLLLINEQIQLPLSIKNDMRKFIDHIEKDANIDLKNLGLKNTRIETILSDLKTIYKITSLPSLGEILTQKRGAELFQITRVRCLAGIGLENRFTGNGDVGSNPTSSDPISHFPQCCLNTIQKINNAVLFALQNRFFIDSAQILQSHTIIVGRVLFMAKKKGPVSQKLKVPKAFIIDCKSALKMANIFQKMVRLLKKLKKGNGFFMIFVRFMTQSDKKNLYP